MHRLCILHVVPQLRNAHYINPRIFYFLMLSDHLEPAKALFRAGAAKYGILFYIGLVVASLVLYIGYRHTKLYILRKRFGAELAPWIPDCGWFNARPGRAMLRMKLEGKLVEYFWNLWNGDFESLRVVIGGVELFATIDPENIKAVLATQFNDFELGIRHAHFKPLLGDGVFTLDYHGWKTLRALLRPNFSREKVGHTQLLETHVLRLFRHIRKYNGSKFDIQELFYRFTVDTSTEFLFGQSCDGLLDELIGEYPEEQFEGQFEFLPAFNRAQEICATRAWLQQWYWIINPSDFKRNIKIVHNFADFYVKKAINLTDEELEKKLDGYVFLYELAKQTKDPVVLRDQLLNIMIAGRDTTASLMLFTMFELSKRPDVWEKLKEEIHTKFGAGEDARVEDITFETLKKCNYLKYVINEVLRLYPLVPINYRFANKHTTLPRGGGKDGLKPVFIEKGTCIGYLISATHRNEKYYGKDSHVFRPERWADKDLKPGWAYLPFNGGPRICLGQQFALTEASYVICRIAQEFPNLFDHDPEPNTYPPRMVSQLTNSLATGCWIAMQS